MRALILDSGNTSSYHVMRSLARAGHEPHLVAGPYCHWHRSRYCAKAIRWPWTNEAEDTDENFLAFLLTLLEAGHYGLLYSCGDTAVERIYKYHEQLSQHVPLCIPDPKVGAIVFDKNAAYRHAQAAGVPIPPTYYPQRLEDVAALRDRLRYPAVVKGQKGSASSNVRFVLRPDALASLYREVYEMERELPGLPAVQEFVGTDGYLVHLLFWHGEPMAVCAHHKDRQFPIGGGVTSAATTVDIPELNAEAVKMARSLNWHGLVKMDFVYDPVADLYRFIEIDPRVSASIDITRAAGADQALMLADLVQGKTVRPALNCKPGLRYRWLFPRDLLVGAAEPSTVLRLPLDWLSPRVFFDIGLDDSNVLFRQLGRFLQERRFLDPEIRSKTAAAGALQRAYERTIRPI